MSLKEVLTALHLEVESEWVWFIKKATISHDFV